MDDAENCVRLISEATRSISEEHIKDNLLNSSENWETEKHCKLGFWMMVPKSFSILLVPWQVTYQSNTELWQPQQGNASGYYRHESGFPALLGRSPFFGTSKN